MSRYEAALKAWVTQLLVEQGEREFEVLEVTLSMEAGAYWSTLSGGEPPEIALEAVWHNPAHGARKRYEREFYDIGEVVRALIEVTTPEEA